MDLQAKRQEYAERVQQLQAALLRLQGAIAVLDEMIAADEADGGKDGAE